MLTSYHIYEVLDRAFREDIGAGDLTTIYTVPSNAAGNGRLLAREKGLLAGVNAAVAAFCYLDNSVECECLLSDGDPVEEGSLVMMVNGPFKPILSSERIAMNLLQRLSGIATQTARWAEEIKDYPARLVDTRKTTPGLRLLEKYAVRIGGGLNHRLALDGGILIKENHITAAGGIGEAVRSIRNRAPFTLRIEVEVTSLEELEEALDAGADIIMLDNMKPALMQQAVELNNGRALLEASGNITRQHLKEVATTGVDFISCGALTHSSRVLDFSFVLER